MKLKAVLLFLATAAMTCAMSSCSDDDGAATPLDTPEVTEIVKTISTLTFQWTEVTGATQYGYELKDSKGTLVEGGVTNLTTQTFSGLRVHTDYVMTLWAYAKVGSDRTTSAVSTITATTNDVMTLGTPTATWENTSEGVVLTWDAIVAASYYSISWYDTEGSILGQATTRETTYTISGLADGTYTIHLQACSDVEDFASSGIAEFSIEAKLIKQSLWTAEAEYYSEVLDATFPCTIISYADGSYEIQGIYGSESSLEFRVDDTSIVDGIPETKPINAYQENAPYYYYSAGDYTMCLYYQRGSGYTGWENGTAESGEVWFYIYLYDKEGNYLGGGYDDVKWN